MIQSFIYISIVLLAFRVFSKAQKWREQDRLLALCTETEVKEEVVWEVEKDNLDSLSDRLGSAGFYEKKARNIFKAIALISFVLITFLLCFKVNIFIAIGVSLYLNALFFLFFLRFRKSSIERETLFKLPIFLESVILLVESGLGVLPAVQQVVNNSKDKKVPFLKLWVWSMSFLPLECLLDRL